MDLACEKCATVYVLDESQIAEDGSTVQCTKCGFLFRVRRRQASKTSELSAVDSPRRTMHGRPSPFTPVDDAELGAAPSPASAAPAPTKTVAAGSGVITTGWIVRSVASGQIYQLADFATLHHWIVERRVVREDQLSKDGQSWRPLGAILELGPFFHVVEQARQQTGVTKNPLAASPTAPAIDAASVVRADEETTPVSHPKLPELPRLPDEPVSASPRATQPASNVSALARQNEPAFAADPSRGRLTPPSEIAQSYAASAASAHDAELDAIDDAEAITGGTRSRARAVLVSALVVVALVVAVAATQGKRLMKLVRPQDLHSDALYLAGREAFLHDTDEGFASALESFDKLHAADPEEALPIAALAELHATWAWYQREDARLVADSNEVAASSLRKQADKHLDEARRAAGDALTFSPQLAEANRAMADFLRVDGAPSIEVERYIARALRQKPDDIETLFVRGALSFRDGKMKDARAELETVQTTASPKALTRAQYVLAKVAVTDKRLDDAKQIARQILTVEPKHARAQALLATLDRSPLDAEVYYGPEAPPAAAAVTTPSPAATPSASPSPSQAALAAPSEPNRPAAAAASRDVDGLTEQGRLALKSEHYLAAVDRFREALALAPQYAPALCGLGAAYRLRGDVARAVDNYEKCAAANPGGPEAAEAARALALLGATPPSPSPAPAVVPAPSASPIPSPSPSAAPSPEVKPEAKPEPAPESKPDVKPEAKPEPAPEAKPEPAPEAKPEPAPALPRPPSPSPDEASP